MAPYESYRREKMSDNVRTNAIIFVYIPTLQALSVKFSGQAKMIPPIKYFKNKYAM